MQKGFTLVELLAVVTLLGIIILVAVPSVIRSNQLSEENSKKELNNDIVLACESYVAVTYNNINDIPSGATISIEDLVKEGYLSQEYLSEAIDKKASVSISVSSGKVVCTYSD
ncbi:MAG: prepilin-type N-terminal cleavage/methylation domain-containing protein [Bacilli bacterium]|nr:prepilin-type N-terminal cleavage/methylation domain-containing protein [Bacilli bacterium]